MSHFHAVVWIDHKEAKVFHFNKDEADKVAVKAGDTSHLRHHANVTGSSHAKTSEAYLHEVCHAVADAGAILITGPGVAKTELIHHMHKHDPQVAKKVAAIETVDHPTDGQLLAHARKYFKSADLETPQIQR
ncbi:MAG: translational machinery protein [Alphaproteobacteria bacterium]|nr:translational machinery protein [Alphaproteobacteria bacterium]